MTVVKKLEHSADAPATDVGGKATEFGNLVSCGDRRRERRAYYQTLELPAMWKGSPARRATNDIDCEELYHVEGIGVSPGVVEGVARVVHDPSFADVAPDEILVAPTTDPSWSAILLISRALVVDVGRALSHAAVVARELGVPCVVGTRNRAEAIRTADLVRLDGDTGVVTILKRAE